MICIRNNYASASDTIWGAWSDSDMRSWLIQNGYLRSDAQVKRDELIKAINDKYKDASTRTAAYLTWPDARLRAYLRQRGVSERALPTSRPGLLRESSLPRRYSHYLSTKNIEETRIRWVQTSNRAEQLFTKIRDLINSSVSSAEDTLRQILELLTGSVDYSKDYANEKYAHGKSSAGEWKSFGDEKAASAGDRVKKSGEKMKSEL
jgi:hypothetical protein